MQRIRLAALCWLIFIFSFFWGYFADDFKLWPHQTLSTIKLFILGHISENLTLTEKLKNDFDFKPSRHIKRARSDKQNNKALKEMDGLSLNPRRELPTIYLSDSAPKGFRLLYGVFDFDDKLHGAILIDHDGQVINTWKISQEDTKWFHHPDTNVFPHGFEIATDGSIVTAYDNGNSLTKYDWCGNIQWSVEGMFHHSIAFENATAIWVWEQKHIDDTWPHFLIKVDYQTGRKLREIPISKIVEANTDIDIFGIRQLDTGVGSKWVDAGGGRWHPNDIDPLPEKFASFYPMFESGDLLISFRSPNLIFILDPNTLRVKWWRQGLTRRQHDPDWNDRGTITVFNNNMHRSYSNIVEIDPTSYNYKIILDGESVDFYTWWRGKHQVVPPNGLLVTSSDQGRVFETDSAGNITFEFINNFGKDMETLAVSEARFIPLDYFKEIPQCN